VLQVFGTGLEEFLIHFVDFFRKIFVTVSFVEDGRHVISAFVEYSLVVFLRFAPQPCSVIQTDEFDVDLLVPLHSHLLVPPLDCAFYDEKVFWVHTPQTHANIVGIPDDHRYLLDDQLYFLPREFVVLLVVQQIRAVLEMFLHNSDQLFRHFLVEHFQESRMVELVIHFYFIVFQPPVSGNIF